jgi:predicted NUDIX family NTP pyrophosphohydrolase
MPERSAGLLLYRLINSVPEVLLIHPGGPYWARKDNGAWSVPKGIIDVGEDPLAAALRELTEETGAEAEGDAVHLGDFRQPSRKIVTVFAVEGDFDLAHFHSNPFTMEWPPKSGRRAEFPEADRAAWVPLDAAVPKLVPGQRPILDALAAHLSSRPGLIPR